MTDAEWAIALAREAAVALFVVRARPMKDGDGGAHAVAGRRGASEPGGQDSTEGQPTVR